MGTQQRSEKQFRLAVDLVRDFGGRPPGGGCGLRFFARIEDQRAARCDLGGTRESARSPASDDVRTRSDTGASETGAANAVMGVLLDYRAYDTLGEATVIFASILGVYTILRRVGRTSHRSSDPPKEKRTP